MKIHCLYKQSVTKTKFAKKRIHSFGFCLIIKNKNKKLKKLEKKITLKIDIEVIAYPFTCLARFLQT